MGRVKILNYSDLRKSWYEMVGEGQAYSIVQKVLRQFRFLQEIVSSLNLHLQTSLYAHLLNLYYVYK